MIKWLKSFPIDDKGTPSGKLTPGIYFLLLITLGVVGICKLLSLLSN